jgi:pyruvate kinase
VVVGGEIRSRKGLNLPGIDLATDAFTENDRRCLEFALAHGVDAVGQSFVESARDVASVRKAAARAGTETFVIAKIERSRALERIDEIIAAADGIMIARGDLGVEIPLEGIAIVQKDLMRKARIAGKPVITATQMLESMIHSRHPTRAEATDVANAVLDGTDCLMLSAESASGAYPVEAVATLARIAAATEPSRQRFDLWERIRDLPEALESDLGMLTAVAAQSVMEATETAVVFAPTRTGSGPRNLARFRMPAWIVAVTADESVARQLALSFGVHVVCRTAPVDDWRAFVRGWVREQGMSGAIAMLVREAEANGSVSNHALELIDIGR